MTSIRLYTFRLWSIEDDPYGAASDVLFDLQAFDWNAHGLHQDDKDDVDNAWSFLVERLKPYADSVCAVWEKIADAFPMLDDFEYHGQDSDTPGGEIYLELYFKRDENGRLVKDGLTYKVQVNKGMWLGIISQRAYDDLSCSF